MPLKLELSMYRAQRAARELLRRGGVAEEAEQGRPPAPEGGPGNSASSPGHRKREAGARSARDFVPGRLNRPARGAASS